MIKAPWIDKEECISCGLCVDNVPEVFRFDDENKAECYDPNGASEDDIQHGAIDVCPVSCINWSTEPDYLKSFA
ncbi:ferredoxin [Geobacter anodireducens]